MDLRTLLGRWLHFLVGLIFMTVAMVTAADGVSGMIAGLIALTLVATIVAIPLIVITALWAMTTVFGFLRRRQYEATGESSTNSDWRSPTSI